MHEKHDPHSEKVENRKDLHRYGTEPSGYDGKNPATAGPGNTGVEGPTPESKDGHINPAAPNDANTGSTERRK